MDRRNIMGLSVRPPKEGGIPPVPAGTYQGVCYLVCDLGTQHNPQFNSDNPKVIIGWEIHDIRLDDGRPRAISKEYTNSMHEKAALRIMLESWSGRELNDAEINGAFDMKRLLGVNAMVQVIHRKSAKGNTYAQVNSVTNVYKGMEKIEAENEFQYFSFEDKMEIPENIPEWIRDKIMDSYEYRELTEGFSGQDEEMPDLPEAGDDIPF